MNLDLESEGGKGGRARRDAAGRRPGGLRLAGEGWAGKPSRGVVITLDDRAGGGLLEDFEWPDAIPLSRDPRPPHGPDSCGRGNQGMRDRRLEKERKRSFRAPVT